MSMNKIPIVIAAGGILLQNWELIAVGFIIFFLFVISFRESFKLQEQRAKILVVIGLMKNNPLLRLDGDTDEELFNRLSEVV